MAFLVPEALRKFISDKSGIVIIKILENSYEISFFDDNQMIILTELESSEKGRADFKSLVENDSRISNADFVVRLTSRVAIKKVIYLPEATADNLYQVIFFELDKYTPYKPEQVYFSVKQLAKDETGLIKALLILTPKDEMDVIYQELTSWGINPKLVDFDEEPNSFKYGEESYNLLRDVLRAKGKQPKYLLPCFLGTMTALLLTVVLALPVYLESQMVDSLKAQLKLLTKDTLLVESQQIEIDNIYEKTVSLIDKKKNTPSIVELLNTLSGLINDATWLTHLQLKAGRLQIQGQSPAASTLIGILESSSLFTNARFVSPLTQDKKTGLERFQISVEIAVIVQGDTGDE